MRCPHDEIVVGKDEYGIFSYYHTRDNASCDLLNMIGVPVQEILYPYGLRFSTEPTPKLKAAFLVSRIVRLEIYEMFSKLDKDNLQDAIVAMMKIVQGAANDKEIWGEARAVFGPVFLNNVAYVTKQDVQYIPVDETLPQHPMTDLARAKIYTDVSREEAVVSEWKERAAQAAAEAAARKSYKSRR